MEDCPGRTSHYVGKAPEAQADDVSSEELQAYADEIVADAVKAYSDQLAEEKPFVDTCLTFEMWTDYKKVVVGDGNGRYGLYSYERRKEFDLHKGAGLALIDLFVRGQKANDMDVALTKLMSENYWEVQADIVFLGMLMGVVGYEVAVHVQSGEYDDPLRQAMLDHCDFPLAIITHNMN